MALAISGPPPQQRMEQLLHSLQGILAARVVLDDDVPVEIHIVCPPDLHPKQVVRNVESALSAGLGIEIDRRVVSVAQVADDAALNGAGPSPAPTRAHGAHVAPPTSRRLVFTDFDARRDADGRVVCRVTLSRGSEDFTGSGEGPDTPAGRADAGASATFSALALARRRDDVALEGVALVGLQDHTYVHVVAHATDGRSTVELTGTAAIHRSPDEAAVLAALQATNRWTGISG